MHQQAIQRCARCGVCLQLNSSKVNGSDQNVTSVVHAVTVTVLYRQEDAGGLYVCKRLIEFTDV